MKKAEQILKLRAENPNLSASEIAKQVNLSRARVGQILADLKLPTRVKISRSEAKSPYRYGVYIPPHTIGALCELEVSVDILKKGGHVFRSISPHAPCDLVVMFDGRLVTIEVRASTNGAATRSGTHDCLALVEKDGRIIYSPPLENFTNKT